MEAPWLLLLAGVLLLIIYFKPKKAPFPSPPALPVIGNLHQIGPLPHRSLLRLAAAHGPVMHLRLGSVPALVLSSADAAKHLADADLAVSGRAAPYAARRYTHGLGVVFVPYGDYWRAARKLCVLELLSARRVQSYRDVREAAVAELVAGIAAAGKNPVNLSEMFLSMSSKTMRRIAFGDGGEHRQFVPVLEEAQSIIGGFWLRDYLPRLGWVDVVTGMKRRLEKNLRELDAYYEHIIEAHLVRAPAPEGTTEKEDIVDVLLRLQHGRSDIKGLLHDIFVAGSDTSAATLTWTMARLLQNPEALARAQKEVRDVAGEKSLVEEPDLGRMKYIKMVIKEALRMHPPVPLLVPRETIAEFTVWGHAVPARTRVLINASAVGMDPAAWSEPEEFRPERFEGSDAGELGSKKAAEAGLLPFGFGRRSCPGAGFAGAAVELALANVLRCFDWEVPDGEAVGLEEAPGLTVHKKDPLRLLAVPVVRLPGNNEG